MCKLDYVNKVKAPIVIIENIVDITDFFKFSLFIYNFNAFKRVLKGSIKHSFLEIFFLSNSLLNKTHSLLNEILSFSKNDKARSIVSFIFLIGLLIDFRDSKLTEAWQ